MSVLRGIPYFRTFNTMSYTKCFFRSSSVSYFETEGIIFCGMIMAVINFFEVGQHMCEMLCT